MYVPSHFAATDDQKAEMLAAPGAGQLVTMTAQGLVATLLPWAYDPAAGSYGSLCGHLARNNPQWSEAVVGEALVILMGPDAYITPTWYASKAEHGRVVPTWNYATLHAYGELVVHDQPSWVEANVRALSDLYERAEARPWSVNDAPADYVAGQLRAIVGVEIRITRIEAKLKLSQNRPAADVDGVIAGLQARGDQEGADAVATARRRAEESDEGPADGREDEIR